MSKSTAGSRKKEPKSKRYIERAFLELLRRKSVDKITVLELCEAADVNKSTFYVYFHDIYDLLDKMQEKEIRKILCTIMENYPDLNAKVGDATKEHRDGYACEIIHYIISSCRPEVDHIHLLFPDTWLYKLPVKLDSLIREMYFRDFPDEKESLEVSMRISYEVYGAYSTYINYPEIDEDTRVEIITDLVERTKRLS